jgi:RluA family pseudouridine synthase
VPGVAVLGCGAPDGREIDPKMPAIPPIVFEDDVMLAVDKPAGMAVAGEAGPKGRPTLLEIIRETRGGDVANVHRLENEASGLVLFAKNKVALDFLSGQFQSKTATKRFQVFVVVLPPERALPAGATIRAGVAGLPDAGVIDLPLVDDQRNPGQVRIGKGRGSRDALTEFKVLEPFGKFAWMECRPATSRAHQIRAHLAAIGAPVLNDRAYGDPGIKLLLSDLKRGYKGRDEEKPLLTRLALHARALEVRHPITREPVTFEAPLPEEFEIALKYLRKFSAGGSMMKQRRAQNSPL